MIEVEHHGGHRFGIGVFTVTIVGEDEYADFSRWVFDNISDHVVFDRDNPFEDNISLWVKELVQAVFFKLRWC